MRSAGFGDQRDPRALSREGRAPLRLVLQVFLHAKWRLIGAWLTPDVRAVRKKDPGLDVVAKHRAERGHDRLMMFAARDRKQQLDAPVEVSRHPIRAG